MFYTTSEWRSYMGEAVCAALRKAGIVRISSPAAIRFCYSKCPYPDCVRASYGKRAAGQKAK
jgi:hypothetical protein